jgi:hypothetical protein
VRRLYLRLEQAQCRHSHIQVGLIREARKEGKA